MSKVTKQGSTAADVYLDHIFGVVGENEGFLYNNAGEVYGEVVGLVNDAIDLIGLDIKKAECRERYVRQAICFFLHHVLQPFSCGIYLDVLTGNLPVCFMELRLVLESLVKCYLADQRYPEQAFFQERLESLEKAKQQGKGISTSRWMRELGEQLGLKNRFVALWGELSQDWVHTAGITNRIVAQLTKKSDVPTWALVMPMTYAQNDLDSLKELGKCIFRLRNLLRAAMQVYDQEYTLLTLSPPSPNA